MTPDSKKDVLTGRMGREKCSWTSERYGRGKGRRDLGSVFIGGYLENVQIKVGSPGFNCVIK